jgi:hypothetical protein
LSAVEQDVESRVKPKGPEGVKEEMAEREAAERAVEFIGVSVFGGVS